MFFKKPDGKVYYLHNSLEDCTVKFINDEENPKFFVKKQGTLRAFDGKQI